MKTTNNNIQIFKSEVFGQVRTMTNAEGETFFVGRDVAKALGYCNTRKALQDHVDKEDKRDGVTIRDSIGRIQKAVFINESGLYALILSSRHGRKSTGANLRWLNIARFKNERRRKRKKKVAKKKVIKKRLSKKTVP